MLNEMKEFDHVLEKDLKELVETIIKKGTISSEEVKKATDAVRLMLKVKEYEDCLMEEQMGGYSGAMDGDRSYRRGRNPMNGQYVSRNYGPSYGTPHMNVSYGDPYMNGYSGHSIKDRAIANLENMMGEAGNEYERQVLGGMINDLRMNK